MSWLRLQGMVEMFAELLENPRGLSPAKSQSEARSRFSQVVAQSHFKLRKPNDVLPRDHIIIGVGSYSPPELKILDELNIAYPFWSGLFDIFVFDVAQCTCLTDFEKYIPGTPYTDNTPVIKINNKYGIGQKAVKDLINAILR